MPKLKGAAAGRVKSVSLAGPDGTIVEARRIRTGTMAVATMKVRCKTGGFEWRYGREGSVKYHAGASFARLWERAGIAATGSGLPQLVGVTGDRPSGGISDARILALDKVREIGATIGGPMTRRLVAYCVEGRTPAEIAASYGGQVTNRQVADTLDLDLMELAEAMNFAK